MRNFTLAVLAVMLGITAYSPELYRIFCQVTGFGGTTQVAVALPEKILDQKVEVRTLGNVAPSLKWSFKPKQEHVFLRPGEQGKAVYLAKNLSDKPLAGTASYNVSPENAGGYFNKIQCFCFTRQVLQPGEEVELPVVFFVDPEITSEETLKNLPAITLSYTFYLDEVQPEPLAALDVKP